MVKTRNRKFESFIAILFIFVIIASAIAVLIIAVCKFQYNNVTFICNLILIKSYLISLYFLFYLIFDQKSYTSNQQRIENEQDYHIRSYNIQLFPKLITRLVNATLVRESNLAIYAFITILGIGDAIFNLTRSIDQFFAILSIDYENKRLYLILSFIENFLKLLYQLFLLFFIIYHKDFINMLHSRSWLKWFVGYLSTLCLIQWIFIILQEIFNERDLDDSKTTSYRLISINLTSFKNYESFLYPLGIEFRICCFIELLFLFLSSFVWVCGRYCISNTPRNSHEDSQIVSLCESKILNTMLRQSNRHNNKHSEIFLLLALSIFLFSFSIIVVLFQYNNKVTNNEIVTVSHAICLLTVMLFMLIVFMFPISCVKNESDESDETIIKKFQFIMQSNASKSMKRQMMCFNKCEIMKKIDFIFLYISFLFLIVHCSFTICGDIIVISEKNENYRERQIDLNVFTIVTSLLTSFQAIMQVKKMSSFKNKGNLNKKLMNIAILMNLTVWMLETFSDKDFNKRHIKIKSFGVDAFENFSPIFLPLAKFFRFHSCIILIKIKYEKYLVKYDHDHNYISF
jgi:hypothetical protein